MMLICFGTRPEWIKIKPVVEAIKGKIPYKLLFTGQHLHILDKIEEPIVKLAINDGPNRLDSIVSSLLNQEEIFQNITSVFVQGDTTSVFSIALAAFHRRIKIIHLEAGLRTYNKDHPFPEEFNRRSVSCMADIHFCPTKKSAKALMEERVNGEIYVVGNTVLDNLTETKTSYTNEIVVTMHRRENHKIMDKWFTLINEMAKNNPEYTFTLPLHPNPNVQKHKDILTHVNVVEPIPYDEFIKKIANCKFIITDSGGIQEESSFFMKKCIVCRDYTERTESLGSFSFLANLNNFEKLFYDVKNDHIPFGECPYGDGMASIKILDKLVEKLNV